MEAKVGIRSQSPLGLSDVSNKIETYMKELETTLPKAIQNIVRIYQEMKLEDLKKEELVITEKEISWQQLQKKINTTQQKLEEEFLKLKTTLSNLSLMAEGWNDALNQLKIARQEIFEDKADKLGLFQKENK